MPISFWQDLKSKEMAPIKLLLFMQAAGDMALYPFFTLHMKYLGITVTEIGIQFAVTPLATLLATPLVGLLADKIGSFRVLLSISLVICGALAQCFAFIPPVIYLQTEIPYEYRATVTCNPNYKSGVSIGLPSNFSFLNTSLVQNEAANNNKMAILNQTFHLSGCNWTCDGETESLVSFVCLYHNETGDEECFRANGKKTSFKIHLKRLDFSEEDGFWETIPENYPFKEKYYGVMNCKDLNHRTMEKGQSCRATCATHLNEHDAPHLKPDENSRSTTFWLYMVVRVLLIVTIATEMSLFKAAILTLVDKCNTEYGFQRLWGTIAACIVPLITGLLMDKLQKGEIEDYTPCFYIYSAMKVIMAIMLLFIPLAGKAPTVEVFKNVVKLVKSPEVCVLLVYVTFVGSCWGFLETFLFWFLEGIGASKSLMGLTFTIGSVCGLLPSIFAGAIERKIGHVAIISIGLFAYAVRFVGYSFVVIPYQALFFESLEALTMSLMLITVTTYANMLASAELVATMQATWAALHFAVGRALGSVIGGYMIDGVGSQMTYHLYAVKAFIMAVLYLIIYNCWLKKLRPATVQESANKANDGKENGLKGIQLEKYITNKDQKGNENLGFSNEDKIIKKEMELKHLAKDK